MGYSGAGGKLIHEKNQKQNILWNCPFKSERIFGCWAQYGGQDASQWGPGLEVEFTWRRPLGIYTLIGTVYYILNIILIWRRAYKQGAYTT